MNLRVYLLGKMEFGWRLKRYKMNLDSLIKYVVWLVLFGIAAYGLYRLFGGLGVA